MFLHPFSAVHRTTLGSVAPIFYVLGDTIPPRLGRDPTRGRFFLQDYFRSRSCFLRACPARVAVCISTVFKTYFSEFSPSKKPTYNSIATAFSRGIRTTTRLGVSVSLRFSAVVFELQSGKKTHTHTSYRQIRITAYSYRRTYTVISKRGSTASKV